MLHFLKGSSKYQVKAEFSDIIHFKHWLLTVCTYTGENHPKELRFQLNLKLFYLRIWWPKISFNYGHCNRRDSGYFFFFLAKITFSRFSQNSLVIHPFEYRCQWLLGGSRKSTLRDPSCPFLALACLSSVLAITLWVVDEVHCSDKGSLLKAFSIGETIHKATYILFSSPESNSFRKKLKGL